ncbi:MAG TPA: hypothetical protein VIF62_29835 [Labilithrix sp.]|jgi:hypothetical protein
MGPRFRRTTAFVGVAAAALLVRAIAACGSYGATSHDDPADAAAPPAPPPSPLEGGSSDASPDADAADAGFCASLSAAATFCSDFDESTDPSSGWAGLTLGDGGTAALDTTFKSAPRSFHSSSAGDPTFLFKTFGGVQRSIDVELDVFLVYDPSTSSMGAVTPIQIDTGQLDTWIFFFADPSKGYFQQAGSAFSTNFPSPLGDWHHLHLTVKLGAGGSTITASADGTPLWTDHPMSPSWPSPASVSLRVGVPALATTPSGATRVDNVVVHVD